MVVGSSPAKPNFTRIFMKILNNIFLTNKHINIQKSLQQTLVDQPLKFSYGSKLLTISKENIISKSVSTDLAFPGSFFKKQGTFMSLQQKFDDTPLYKPFLPKIHQQFFLSLFLHKILKKNKLTLLPSLVLNVILPKKINFLKLNTPSTNVIVWFGVLGVVFKKIVNVTVVKGLSKKKQNLNIKKPLLGQRVLLPIKTVNLKKRSITLRKKLLIKNKI